MPGGDWVRRIEAVGSALGRAPLWIAINACLALVLIFLILLPYPWTPSANHQGNTHVEQYRSDCDKADARYREFVSEPHYSGKRDDGSQYDAEKARLADELVTWCDLAAQHFAAAGATSAAKSSWWTFWTALFGVLLLVLTLWETRRVTKVTREIGKKQTRAYISVEILDGACMFATETNDREFAEVIIGGKVIVKNNGTSTAKEIRARAYLYVRDCNIDAEGFKLLLANDLAPSKTDNDYITQSVEFRPSEIQSFGQPAAFTARVDVSYFDVFEDPQTDSFFFFLHNGNAAAKRTVADAKRFGPMHIDETDNRIEVTWHTESQKTHDERNARFRARGLLR